MVDFRLATEADIPLLRDLARRIWTASYREMLSPAQIEYMLGWMYAEETILRELRGAVRWELITLDGEAIGYLALGSAGGGEWKLHKLYVLPEQQGRSIGTAALEHACALAASRGGERLSLNVNKQNARALRCYQRAGFQVTGALVNDIGGGFVMDDFVLSLALTPPGKSVGQRVCSPLGGEDLF